MVSPPGMKLPMHIHPVINAGMLIRGQLLVISEAGPSLQLRAGDGLIEMVKDPYAFWERQRVFAERGMSYNSLFGQFVLRLAAVRPC